VLAAPVGFSIPRVLLCVLVATSCVGRATSPDTSVGDAAPGTLRYFSDPCGSGDPVGCAFTDPVDVPDSAHPTCVSASIVENDPCTQANAKCVLVPARMERDAGASGCRQSASFLTCLATRRDTGAGGCPIH